MDIIKYSEDPAEFISAALSPADVIDVRCNEEEKTCRVVVPDDQLSLAIGKEGQNARLAAKLTGYKIDIKSESNADERRTRTWACLRTRTTCSTARPRTTEDAAEADAEGSDGNA